jgi:hypothetical protein
MNPRTSVRSLSDIESNQDSSAGEGDLHALAGYSDFETVRFIKPEIFDTGTPVLPSGFERVGAFSNIVHRPYHCRNLRSGIEIVGHAEHESDPQDRY